MADEAQNAPLKRKLPIKLIVIDVIVIDVIGTALLVVGYIEQNHLAKKELPILLASCRA